MSDLSEHAREMGKKGGKARTDAKQAAARENGKSQKKPWKPGMPKRGRPKK